MAMNGNAAAVARDGVVGRRGVAGLPQGSQVDLRATTWFAADDSASRRSCRCSNETGRRHWCGSSKWGGLCMTQGEVIRGNIGVVVARWKSVAGLPTGEVESRSRCWMLRRVAKDGDSASRPLRKEGKVKLGI